MRAFFEHEYDVIGVKNSEPDYDTTLASFDDFQQALHFIESIETYLDPSELEGYEDFIIFKR